MSNIYTQIGANIRRYRKARHMTMQQLADAMPFECSCGMIGFWERADRKPTAEQIYALSVALKCSVNALYATDNELFQNPQERIRLSEREKETIVFCAKMWDGDTHALLEFIRMYVAIPREYRTDISGLAINQVEHLIRDGAELCLDIDLAYLQKECDRIED